VANAEECDSYTTPIFRSRNGQTEMIVMGGNQLDAYDPATGKLRWFLPGLTGGRTITGAVVAGDMVYATRGQKGELLGVKVDASSTAGGSQLADGAVTFRHKESTPDSCCPVVWKDRVYTISRPAGCSTSAPANTSTPSARSRVNPAFPAPSACPAHGFGGILTPNEVVRATRAVRCRVAVCIALWRRRFGRIKPNS
jgi:outer membrane protein assembly factor BamB